VKSRKLAEGSSPDSPGKPEVTARPAAESVPLRTHAPFASESVNREDTA
jgi:hypothetical protein